MKKTEKLKSLDLENLRPKRQGKTLVFRGVNQKALLAYPSDETDLYRFEYFNEFYGTCQIESKIRPESSVGFALDPRSIKVNFVEVRSPGSEPLLEAASIRFINRQLRQFELPGTPDKKRKPAFWKRMWGLD